MKHARQPLFKHCPIAEAMARAGALLLAAAAPCALGDGGPLEEVVVTAQKRAEGLQDVPLAVSALSAERLEDAGVESIDQATALLPSFTFSNGVEPRNTSIRIRGIGTQSFSLAVEPSVSMVIDGIVTGRPGAALEDIADIERIEVLRGPQGTLFGKNASAGVINIITKGPNEDEFEGYIRAGIAEDGEFSFKSALTGPLSERSSYRLNAFYRELDGVAENVSTGDTVGGIDGSWGIRGKFRYNAGASFDFTLTADLSEKESECCVRAGREIFIENSFLERSGTPIGPENLDVSEDADVFADSENAGIALEANWGLGGEHTLTYIGGFRSWENTANLDNDSTRFDFIPRQGGTTESEVVTHELRLSSPAGGAFDYVAGLYYFNHASDRAFMDIGCRLNELDEMAFDFDKGKIAGCSLEAGTEGSGNWMGSVENENYAAFAHVNIHATSRLTLLAGLRVLSEELEFDFMRDNPATGNLGGRLIGKFEASESTSDTAAVWKAGVQYQWTDEVMGYLTASTGYKGQAYNISQPLSAATLEREPLDPEESEGFELGLKSALLDNRLILNIAAFTTDIDGFQTNGRDPETNANIFRNAATVRTRGVEIDFSAAPGDNLVIHGGITFLDATFDEFAGAPCYPGQTAAMGCVDNSKDMSGASQDLGGAPFNNAPDTKLTFSAKWSFPLGSWSAWLQPAYVWQDDVIFNFNQDPNRVQDAYGLLHAQFGLASPGGGFEVSVYGRNLTDEFYATDIYRNVPTVSSANGYYHTFARDVRRYLGANVKFAF